MRYSNWLLSSVAVLSLFGCETIEKERVKPIVPSTFEVTMPLVEVPRTKVRKPLEHRPEALPGDAKGRYPTYQGSSFHVTFPVSEAPDLNSNQVLNKFVLPSLKSMGFDPANNARIISAASESGVKNTRADLKSLMDQVNDEYQRNPKLVRAKTREMVAVLNGRADGDVTDSVSKALEMGEGMTLDQYKASIARLEIVYPFRQAVGDVPIEHTLVNASRWEGQSIHAVYGSFYNDFDVVNAVKLSESDIIETLAESLLKVRSIGKQMSKVDRRRFRKISIMDGPHLVLLPYGTDSTGQAQMHYAYRMIAQTYFMQQRDFQFLLWLDAQTGKVLKLESLTQQATASGEIFNRAPDVGTFVRGFQVDNAVGGNYQLSLSGVMSRVDYLDNGFDGNDISISDSANGSSGTFANFNQTPVNDEGEALCISGSNKAYQQVNFFANIYKYRAWTMANGIFTPFPASPWSPRVESASAGCNAYSSMNFGVCNGYVEAACPDYVGGASNFSNRSINTAMDNTWVAHEIGHSITPRYTNTRPADWCGAPPCAVPLGWGSFHDLADFWADHFESTNCWSGWFSKNIGGLDANLNCAGTTSEGGGVPRLHEVDVPFNAASPKDHFPEHRDIGSGPYSDMQIGTVALWLVRQGMRSKCRPSGTPQFAVRFARALKRTGFFTNGESDDRRVYEFLYDLESQMADEWATAGSPGGAPAFRHNGSHTLNKVTAGFAATGLFLVPSACIDSDAATSDPGYCPSGEFGGDAVIDIDDNDAPDDLVSNGVTQKEVDFLELGGAAPSFDVWTGPRYRFNSSGSETLTSPAPCNAQYNVEVSTSDTFAGASTQQSGWITVDVDPATTAPDCYDRWTPNAAQWGALQSGGDGSRIYYRVRTRDAGGLNERISTQPANGLWTAPPPYSVITNNGQSDY